MYAAAGGASLASRQARQKQRQEKKNRILQAKLHPPKAPGAVGLGAGELAGGASTPTRSASRQFHQLPTNYLRAPQAMGRKLSATYTTQSKLLLPIDEGDTQSVLQLRMHSHSHSHAHPHAHSHSHGHGHAQAQAHSHLHHSHLLGAVAPPTPGPPQTPYQQFASSHGRVSPKLVHRHSGSSAGYYPAAAAAAAGRLHKSATATLPLVSHMDMEAALPSAVVGVKTTVTSLETATPTSPPLASTSAAAAAASADAEAEIEVELTGAAAMFVPHHDAIIVTPATPMASPGHVAKLRRPGPEEVPETAAERQPLTAGEAYDDDEHEHEPMHPPPGQLERKCSVYRMRRSDAFEDGDGDGGVTGGLKRQLRELQFSTGVQQTQYEPLLTDEPQLLFKGLGNGRKWQICAYCEEGICVCEHLECAQGRAAWLERGRRCSVQDQQQQQATLSRRWVKRNRIQDASLGGSSDDEDFLGVLRGPSTFANAFLYVGLGTVALGLVIAFVGTGEKGFKTVELRLIGPSLIGLGLICCILRILFCICPSHCISSSKKTRKKNGNKIDADHTTSLLRNESKRVSIARGPGVQPKYPIAHKRSQSKMLNEGMEALRQIATTSLFMQNDQKTAINRVVPIINEPDSGDAPLEMKKLQTALSACEMSEEEQEEKARQQQQRQIAKRTTTATTAVTSSTTKDPTIPTKAARATTLSTVDEKPDSKLVRQRVALQQQRQQQQQQVKQEQHPAQQASKSQSLSSSSTVKDSLDGTVVVEETSLIDATNVATNAVPVKTPAPVSAPASAAAPLPSSCSTGAIPRLKTNNTVSFTSSQATRPGISTGATPKTTPTSSRLPTSQSHPTSYDLPPALPHTYSATATVRGPLGMSMSTSTYTMTTSKVGPSAASTATSASAFAALPPTTTTISLLPLPAPPTMATAMTSIPGQVPEGGGATSHTASLSLSLMQPTAMRPASASASASSMAMSTSSFSTENKSHPSSASTTRGRGSQLLAPPALASTSASASSKCEPELVLSPAKLGQ
ncbi:uncharacterized protein LOC6593830 [Drosophila persimilis]|uniref:uncharacterized protein LOC6593830 n=1 Tax=Drosophila persimilis TaxID=7234 RepID=UPI000F07A6D8|nr:uncharacterized protein LOC6593830 [Drosophila persimilis]